MHEKYQNYISAKKLPPIPATIRPLPHGDGDQGQIRTVVIAGLNLLGEKGYVCPTVSVISSDEESGELFGWSLCLGNPDSGPDNGPYHFRTSKEEGVGTAKGTEIPNTMTYFQAEVDAELAGPEADLLKLDEVIAYALPYISDAGPPPADGKSFAELIAEMPVSDAEREAALLLKEKVADVLVKAGEQFTGNWDFCQLFEALNRKLHASHLSFAWKSDPASPDYNPDLGIVEQMVAGRRVTASIGLSKDRFAGPCAVVQIANHG